MDQSIVTISQAAAMLGVSEVALRHWTDDGRIEAFITPGGHRRYSKSELKKFMSSHRKTIGKRDLVAMIEATGKLHSEIGRTSLADRNWFSRLRDDERLELAQFGRDMLGIISSYINEPAKREETLKYGKDVGCGFGETLARLGLPLVDSVETFILHRDPIMTAIAHLIRKGGNHCGMVVDAIPLTARILDEALVSLVAAHQRFRSGPAPEKHIG